MTLAVMKMSMLIPKKNKTRSDATDKGCTSNISLQALDQLGRSDSCLLFFFSLKCLPIILV